MEVEQLEQRETEVLEFFTGSGEKSLRSRLHYLHDEAKVESVGDLPNYPRLLEVGEHCDTYLKIQRSKGELASGIAEVQRLISFVEDAIVEVYTPDDKEEAKSVAQKLVCVDLTIQEYADRAYPIIVEKKKTPVAA